MKRLNSSNIYTPSSLTLFVKVVIRYGKSFGTHALYYARDYYTENDLIIGFNSPWGGRFVQVYKLNTKCSNYLWE